MSAGIDSVIAYRFLQILTTPWDEQEAFKLGIIDDEGKVLRRARTLRLIKEKDAYTIFHRLIFGIKRLLNKVPGAGTRLGSFATALFLIKEDVVEDHEAYEYLYEDDLPVARKPLQEGRLAKGTYKLSNDILVGDLLKGRKGDIIDVPKTISSKVNLLGDDVFEVIHRKTKEKISLTKNDIK